MITDYMLTNKHAHALNGNFGPILTILIPLWLVWSVLAGLVTFYAGTRVGDYDWPWEHQHEGDEDDGSIIDPIIEPIKKSLGGLLLLGALILGATLLTGRGK
jgi:hypothetical protein